jgi:ATP-dependent exoDNAse (exonuclease V) alpha subunit
VNVYKEAPREFATGDRIQFTAKDKDLGVSNRDLGTITKLEPDQITVRLDGKDERTVSFDPGKMQHFDHGYAVTSHVSQGLTEGRVIANIDTESSRSLINTRLAYVAVSRASDDARIYTNNAETLGARLATDISKTAAVDFRQPGPGTQRHVSEPTINQYADPSHRIAAVASAYAERPDSTVIIAPDRAERQELNQIIRADLQARGQVAPDSKSFTVHIEQTLHNPRLAEQYTPGDRIQYRLGSLSLGGIAKDSVAIVVATDSKTNQLTVQTSAGDEVTYRPHLAKDMTAQSTVYREEQREIAPGDRIQINESYPKQGIRKGDLGTVTAISDTNDLDIHLDKGKSVQLNEEQAHHIEHGYAVQNIKAGAPERVLITQETLEGQGDPASLSRNAREVSLYTSDGSGSNQALKTPIALPEQQQLEAPANVVAPDPMHVEHRRSIGR